MRWHVDPWSPNYGSAFEAGPDSAAQSSATLDLRVEREPEAWQPISTPADVRAVDVVLLVDGVRRNDALLWTREDDGSSYAGLAASYAAGVVRCDLRAGAAGLAGARVGRGLFTASPSATAIRHGSVAYELHRTQRADPAGLQAAVGGPLTQLEVSVAVAVREASDERDDLLVIDGPLLGRAHLPRAIGYVKTHHKQYLPPELSTVVTALPPGHRTPVFRLGTNWHRHSWYLRLPAPPGAPWSGIVRLECSAELSPASAVGLADLASVTLPRFASSAYKDPRAPQNLIPVGGLEKRLRAMLGDARLLHRALMAGSGTPAVTVSG